MPALSPSEFCDALLSAFKWCMMHFSTVFVSLLAFVGLVPLTGLAQTSDVDAYIARQQPISKTGVLANIGPDGSKARAAGLGIVVASPSTRDPDYFYTWTRDSGLVLKMLVDQFVSGIDPSLRTTIDNYVIAQGRIQQVSNPSGSVSTGGLGEPKFLADGSAFTGGWGRPQRDGPALRATSLIPYANWLIRNSNTTFVTQTLWPILKLDLDYVANEWNKTGFDLWEEVNSSSFFTTAVQHRALREGLRLATALNLASTVPSYGTQADNILCFLQSYWNGRASSPFMTANTGGGRSGIDANSVLASIHTFDPAAGCDSITFQPCSDKALINLLTYTQAFRIYTINAGAAKTAALATGRYTEDVYMGGHPWYLTTLAVAEQLYDALSVWNAQGSLQITDTSLGFFTFFSPAVTTGTYASDTATYTTLTDAIKSYADSYLLLVQRYTPADGSLSEQYNRNNGSPLSARDLTWSYAATITAFQARSGANLQFDGWGAAGLTVPAVCQRSGGGGGGGGGVAVTFNVQATTFWGENIFITGNVGELKNWSPYDAILLSSANYPTWSITVNLPANTNIEYKFIRKYEGSSRIVWESDPNRSFTTPASGAITRNESWR